MNTTIDKRNIHQDPLGQDPLGLGELPLLTPDKDGWPLIRQALEDSKVHKRQWRSTTAWLAIAASLVLAVMVTTRQSGLENGPTDQLATQNTSLASVEDTGAAGDTLGSLIALSQTLERQLRNMRDETASMPASSAVYVAELQDLVAQVDSELSYAPDSKNLWGQRVNLLLDLAQIYQQQWERDYGQMASL